MICVGCVEQTNSNKKEQPKLNPSIKTVENSKPKTEVVHSNLSIENDSINYNKYKNGKKDGLWREFHENGKLGAEVYFKDGEEVGIKRLYYENGQVERENNWKENKIIPEKCWDINGKEIDCT